MQNNEEIIYRNVFQEEMNNLSSLDIDDFDEDDDDFSE